MPTALPLMAKLMDHSQPTQAHNYTLTSKRRVALAGVKVMADLTKHAVSYYSLKMAEWFTRFINYRYMCILIVFFSKVVNDFVIHVHTTNR